ncbi:bifunctional DNA-formamidopyrimidine glycosylase/DNA-(apurinic or apyrimidinic site) lyase [Nitrospira moscoviensis]|uniref:Formamidopyrimidine-DNA glycosylase n=1 Tax=Nitrospira moscoviensis TaxID=42253 RepID=A0A0K2G8E4_NITMO|nr:bifunctional DNA-formamidopyrimidine glycosylase/DNA-(apurinic or apyrimidinic site) lyase [Nitrospira moscoviensis]ALA57124.1 DNA-formamidopyrimidine glycosylase and DNA-(Apurinic or apyrimidinic site) lyase [Nitrospira moscoviensis]
MPELPEAEVAARQLRACLSGKRVADMWVGRPDIIREGGESIGWYRGSLVRSVTRQGKSVIVELEKGAQQRYLVAELGMTGLLLLPTATIKHPQHIHMTVTFDRHPDITVRYWNPRRFGRLSLLDREGLDRYIARRFGHDPLLIGQEEFVGLLRRHRRRLKPLLMHQQIIAGIGNIYANEILFRTALHPNAVASRLKRTTAERLYRTMQAVLREAIARGGSSVKDFFAPDGTEGRYKERHLVYAQENRPCHNGCGAVIRRLVSERSSFYCPLCQKNRRCP